MFPIHTIGAYRGLLVGLGLGALLALGGCGGSRTTGTQVEETEEMKAATEDMRSLYYNNPEVTGHPTGKKKADDTKKK